MAIGGKILPGHDYKVFQHPAYPPESEGKDSDCSGGKTNR